MVPIGATSTSFYALHCVLKGIYTQTKGCSDTPSANKCSIQQIVFIM